MAPNLKLFIVGGACLMAALAGTALWLQQAAVPARQTSQSNPPTQISAGAIYAASFTDLAGVPQSLGRWQQKLLVVNFWATWCGPCKEEMPVLQSLQQKYTERGLQIVGIAADSRSNVANFNQKIKVDYPLLPDEAAAIDFSKRLGNRSGFLPHTVVVKPGGEILYSQVGAVIEQDFAAIIIKNLPK